MLFQSQQNVLDAAEQTLRENPSAVLVLEGLVGQGKTTLVRALAERTGEHLRQVGLYSDTGPEKYRDAFVSTEDLRCGTVARIVGGIRSTAKHVIVMTHPSDGSYDALRASPQSVVRLSLGSLHPDEITQWIESAYPAATQQERTLVHRYSLGIPAIIEQMFRSTPLTDDSAMALLQGYILLSSRRMALREECFVEWKKKLRACFLENTGREVPEDALTRDLYGKHGDATLPLTSVFRAHVDHAVPRCPETLSRYEAWLDALHRNESNNIVCIFVPDAGGNTDRLVEELGVQSHEGCDHEKRLGQFAGAMAGRKLASFFVKKFGSTAVQRMVGTEGCGHAANELDLFLQFNRMGQCPWLEYDHFGREQGRADIADDRQPFLLHCYDHEEVIGRPAQVGLAVETLLQGWDIPYQVRLGAGAVTQYDPETHSMSHIASREEFELPHQPPVLNEEEKKEELLYMCAAEAVEHAIRRGRGAAIVNIGALDPEKIIGSLLQPNIVHVTAEQVLQEIPFLELKRDALLVLSGYHSGHAEVFEREQSLQGLVRHHANQEQCQVLILSGDMPDPKVFDYNYWWYNGPFQGHECFCLECSERAVTLTRFVGSRAQWEQESAPLEFRMEAND